DPGRLLSQFHYHTGGLSVGQPGAAAGPAGAADECRTGAQPAKVLLPHDSNDLSAGIDVAHTVHLRRQRRQPTLLQNAEIVFVPVAVTISVITTSPHKATLTEAATYPKLPSQTLHPGEARVGGDLAQPAANLLGP